MKKQFLFLFLALLLVSVIFIFVQEQKVQGIYLGVKDYGSVSKEQKDDFVHRFFVNGKEVEYKIIPDKGYAIQNILAEGYGYDLSIKNGVVINATASQVTAQGTITDMTDTTISIGEKVVAWKDTTAIYQINSQAGGATVTKTSQLEVKEGVSAKVYDDDIYITFVAEEYEAPVRGISGKRTLKNFLATAMEPVGTTLYVYGGGWDWQDVGSSPQTTTLSLPQHWIDFFQSQDDTYTYQAEDATHSYYPFGEWNQYYFAGVDCSGYIGWVMYHVMNTVNGNDGYVMSSTKIAKTLAENGLGTWTQNIDGAEDFKPGDIFSMNGHVWICLGVCEDGSIVILHSTPSDSKAGFPGGGVQLSGVGNSENCQGVQLAQYYMQKYFTTWSQRYDAVFKAYEDYTTFSGDTAGKFSWYLNEQGLQDPDGYAEMSAAAILSDLFGEEDMFLENE